MNAFNRETNRIEPEMPETYNFCSLDVQYEVVGSVRGMLGGVVPCDAAPVPTLDAHIHTLSTVPRYEAFRALLFVQQSRVVKRIFVSDCIAVFLKRPNYQGKEILI